MPWFLALPWLHYLHFSEQVTWHTARFEKGSRYYELTLQRDLLSDWILVASNGRIQSKLGQTRTLAFPSYEEALKQFSSMAKTRYQRGYQTTAYRSDASLYTHLIAIMAGGQPIISTSKRDRFSLKAPSIPPKTKSQGISSQQSSFIFNLN